LRVPVGATLVRHSTAAGEVAETHAKAAGVLAALGLAQSAGQRSGTGGTGTGMSPATGTAVPTPPASLAADPEIQAALVGRNATLAPFWLHERTGDDYLDPALRDRRVLVVDAEDTFTGMLTHQLRVLGLSVTLRSHRSIGDTEGFDLVVAGPGPGDPRADGDPKMAVMRELVARLLADRRPTLAVCLGHQLLAAAIGLPLYRKPEPYQGMQRQIDFFGRLVSVGFYSTFTARCSGDWLDTPYGSVRIARDPATGDVHALRGPAFAGVQFHPESVLSEHGISLVRELVTQLLRTPVES
jgi:phenazine biosynthesis protein phzE